jgi:hypothetical protein
MSKRAGDENLLLPEQAIALLRKQLDVPVEKYRHDDPRIDGWERVTLKIVERTFGTAFLERLSQKRNNGTTESLNSCEPPRGWDGGCTSRCTGNSDRRTANDNQPTFD